MKLQLRVAAFCGGLLGAAVVQAGDPAAAATPKPEPAETPADPSGIKIYVDPATGQWSEQPVTEEQKRQATQAVSQDLSKITTIQHADGSIEYRMNGQMLESVVARRSADGTLQITCSEHGSTHDHGALPKPVQGARDVR